MIDRARVALQPWLGWIVGAWALGVLVLSIRLLGGWVRLGRLTRIDVAAVPEPVREAARGLAVRLAVSRPVRLVRSARAAVPSVVGWVRPLIILPASALTGLSPAQLESIIAHELAHVRRHDYLVNLVQVLIETLLFYHPVVWWVSQRVREEREHCCDDLAVSVCGDRRLYAGALLRLETLRAPAARLAVAADGTSLVARVRRLAEQENTGAPFGQPHWLTFRDGELFLAQESGTVLRFTFDGAGNAVFNGTIVAGNRTRGIQTNPVTGEILVSNLENSSHRFVFDAAGNSIPNGLVTGGGMNHIHGMTFSPPDASARAIPNGSFTVPGNLGGIQFASRVGLAVIGSRQPGSPAGCSGTTPRSS